MVAAVLPETVIAPEVVNRDIDHFVYGPVLSPEAYETIAAELKARGWKRHMLSKTDSVYDPARCVLCGKKAVWNFWWDDGTGSLEQPEHEQSFELCQHCHGASRLHYVFEGDPLPTSANLFTECPLDQDADPAPMSTALGRVRKLWSEVNRQGFPLSNPNHGMDTFVRFSHIAEVTGTHIRATLAMDHLPAYARKPKYLNSDWRGEVARAVRLVFGDEWTIEYETDVPMPVPRNADEVAVEQWFDSLDAAEKDAVRFWLRTGNPRLVDALKPTSERLQSIEAGPFNPANLIAALA